MIDHTAIRRRIQAKVTFAKIAAEIGISRQAVCMWREVPMEHVMKVSAVTGIPAHELRPDEFKGHIVKRVASASASRGA